MVFKYLTEKVQFIRLNTGTPTDSPMLTRDDKLLSLLQESYLSNCYHWSGPMYKYFHMQTHGHMHAGVIFPDLQVQ